MGKVFGVHPIQFSFAYIQTCFLSSFFLTLYPNLKHYQTKISQFTMTYVISTTLPSLNSITLTNQDICTIYLFLCLTYYKV